MANGKKKQDASVMIRMRCSVMSNVLSSVAFGRIEIRSSSWASQLNHVLEKVRVVPVFA